jgi:hypothetical protein
VNVLEEALRRITTDLARQQQPWALVGGFAVSARAEPRFTRDVDVAVTVSGDPAAERLVRSLLIDGYQLTASVEHEATGRLATARLTTRAARADGVVVDVLFANPKIGAGEAAGARVVDGHRFFSPDGPPDRGNGD